MPFFNAACSSVIVLEIINTLVFYGVWFPFVTRPSIIAVIDKDATAV
jgi:hypothetical protein